MQEEAAAGQVPIQGDRLFHLRIAEIANNSVLLRVVGELFDERHNPLSVKLGDYFENPASWKAAIAEHGKVIEAIAAGDAARAREAMRYHLRSEEHTSELQSIMRSSYAGSCLDK